MKRAFCILLALITVLLCSVSAAAVDYGCDVQTVSGAVYLENLDTGTAVFEKYADARMYPASTTKIMTYVIVAEHVPDFDSARFTIHDAVFADIDPESTVMGLADHVGEQISVRDLLYGMMLPSGNDAALVLADYVGEGVDGFVAMMNAKAVELGCTNTHFMNPHGLFDQNHYTTARDMAAIAKYARTLPGFTEITGTVSYTPAGFDDALHNTNYMLDPTAEGGYYYYPYATGIKTGFLDEAGKCLVSTAEKDGFTYLCVALGATYSYEDDINYAMLDTKSLYDWAYTNLGKQVVYAGDEVVKTVAIKYGKGEDKLSLIPEGELSALLPNDFDQNLVRVDVRCEDEFEAPITQGQILGTATVYYDDMTVGTTNIIASKDIELDSFQKSIDGFAKWFRAHFVLIAIIAAVLLIAFIVISAMIRAHKKRLARERVRRRYRKR